MRRTCGKGFGGKTGVSDSFQAAYGLKKPQTEVPLLLRKGRSSEREERVLQGKGKGISGGKP